MPTGAEWTELRNTDNCSWTWTTLNGVNGYKVRSKKTGYTDNWIFIPAAGDRYYDYLDFVGSIGFYWSSSLDMDSPKYACGVHFDSGSVYRDISNRYFGYSVRPVYDNRPDVTGVSLNLSSMNLSVGETGTLSAVVTPSDAYPDVIWTSSDEAIATVTATGVVTAMAKGVAIITATTVSGGYTASCNVNVEDIVEDTEDTIEVDAVDLGLSVKWATCNLGASKPEDYGGYYQWAGTEDVSDKSIWLYWDYCPYHTGYYEYSGWSKYNTISSYGTVDYNITLAASDDVATVKLGGKWRMPTDTEWTELRTDCTWTWITLNGVEGYKVQSNKEGYTDNWIFLPAGGERNYRDRIDVGALGYYWSSSLDRDNPSYAYNVYFNFNLDEVSRLRYYRYYGLSVRPVSE